MKHVSAIILLLSASGLSFMATPQARSQDRNGRIVEEQDTKTDKEIRDLLSQYEHSLNRGDPQASLELYANDAVLMTPNHDTWIGKAGIRQAYEGFAKIMAFDVRFRVRSIVQMSPDWAYARTSSSGTTTNRATNAVVQEANQELFVMKRDGEGRWHIAVYSFSSTNPQP
jgi:uncharacterized protein (TIGR02246 family)